MSSCNILRQHMELCWLQLSLTTCESPVNDETKQLIVFAWLCLQVRTKVFKCLGTVVEADSRIMALPEVAVAVHAAQEDDSAAVKEAVLELLVKLINTNPELAGQYFEALVNASYVSTLSTNSAWLLNLCQL